MQSVASTPAREDGRTAAGGLRSRSKERENIGMVGKK